MEKDLAIKVENVSKTFRIPHEKISSLRGAFVSVLSRDKGYEEFKALDDVSFEVKKGEFFGIYQNLTKRAYISTIGTGYND